MPLNDQLTRNTQRPAVHGTALQQSLADVHCCPYSAHTVGVPPAPAAPPALDAPPAPAVPPDPVGGGVGGEQVPLVDPAVVTQAVPRQQSAVVVQAPSVGTHSTLPQTNGGVPDGFGKHGLPQQSALDAQGVPSGGGPFTVQS
jgi:hypothetical protein